MASKIINFRLPEGVDPKEISDILAAIAKKAGFISKQRPERGSVGHLLYALATGHAHVIKLNGKEETAKPTISE